MSNILEHTLRALSIKHTKAFVNKIYNEDPDRNNLRGLSRMLSLFGVHSSGYMCHDYHCLFAEHPPFIISAENRFFLVLSINEENITIRTSSKTRRIATSAFFPYNNLAVLLLEKSDNASEPDIKEHKEYERDEIIKILAIIVPFCIVLVSLMHSLTSRYGTGEWVFIGLNTTALVLCYFLLEKQTKGKSLFGDKICLAFKTKGCNAILDSTAAKPFFSITWSELGFGYFGVNTVIALLYPSKFSSLALICLCSVLVSIWSLVYQLSRKAWCPLCVLTQSCVILQGADIVGFKMIPFVFVDLDSYGFILLYPILILSIHYIVRYCNNSRNREDTIHRLYPIVTDSSVFNYRLRQQQYINVGDSDSSIIIGNLDAPNTLTVFSNPHCMPCAETHRMISSFLKRLDEYRVQYIFAAFGHELEHDSKALISCYLNYKNSYESLLDEWYKDGVKNPDIFFNNHRGPRWDNFANEEIAKHKRWAANSGIRTTPTLLLNGFILPKEYSVKDLVYIDCEE